MIYSLLYMHNNFINSNKYYVGPDVGIYDLKEENI